MSESKTSPRKVQAAERAEQAVKMRIQGANYAEIGAALGVTSMGAYKMVSKHLAAAAARATETAAEILQQEYSRLDALTAAIWQSAVAGDLKAIDRALAIHDRRAKLAGLFDSKPAPEPTTIEIRYIDQSE